MKRPIVAILVVLLQFHGAAPHHGPTLPNHLELGRLSQCQAENKIKRMKRTIFHKRTENAYLFFGKSERCTEQQSQQLKVFQLHDFQLVKYPVARKEQWYKLCWRERVVRFPVYKSGLMFFFCKMWLNWIELWLLARIVYVPPKIMR